MDLLGIVFIFLSAGSFCVSAFLIASGKAYGFPISGLAFMFFGFALLLLGIFLTWLMFRLLIRRLTASHFDLSRWISTHWYNPNAIIFEKKADVWLFEYDKTIVRFNLRGCFFKKSFLIAFVTRAIRYPVISERMPVAFLGSNSIRCFDKKMSANVSFVYKSDKKDFTLVKNGFSKCGLIACLMIKSKLPPTHERFKPASESAGNHIINIDEEVFVNYL